MEGNQLKWLYDLEEVIPEPTNRLFRTKLPHD
jgi:hypothetical protein